MSLKYLADKVSSMEDGGSRKGTRGSRHRAELPVTPGLFQDRNFNTKQNEPCDYSCCN